MYMFDFLVVVSRTRCVDQNRTIFWSQSRAHKASSATLKAFLKWRVKQLVNARFVPVVDVTMIFRFISIQNFSGGNNVFSIPLQKKKKFENKRYRNGSLDLEEKVLKTNATQKIRLDNFLPNS